MGFGHGAIAHRARAFVQHTRAGATAIASAAVTVMTVGAAALITDHVWLYDQRDVLKTAAEAASIAATLDIDRQLAANPQISDADLKDKLLPVAERYVLANLAHLAPKRFKKAKKSLELELELDRAQHTVSVTARADLGGTLFARNLPLLGNYKGPEDITVHAGVESQPIPVEVVLTVDVSQAMVYGLDGSFDPVDNRLAIVKRAAKNLVAILEPNQHDQVAIGLVLWTSQVRLDPSRTATWVARGWTKVAAGTVPAPEPGETCFGGRRMYAGAAAVPRANADALFALPGDAPFAEVLCQGKYSGSIELMPPMLPLSDERTVINNRVDALYNIFAGGRSDSALGVLWAQRMLEHTWNSVWGGTGVHPADPAKPKHAKLRKAIVLLTSHDDAPQGVSRAEACTAVKSQGTEIFVIAAMVPGDISSALAQSLRDCSSENDKEYPQGTRRRGTSYVFLNNTTPEVLEAAFTDIANQLRMLRKVS